MNIFINAPFSSDNMKIIELAANGCNIVSNAGEADIYVGEPDKKISGGRLKFLQLTCAGAEKFCGGIVDEDVIIANVTGAFGEIISEYVIGAVLSFYREFFIYREQQQKSIWNDLRRERMIYGSRALILGCGNIGGMIAKRLKAFDAMVVGIRRTPRPKDFFDEIYGMDKLEKQLALADLVICCLPDTPLTKNILNEKRLSLMRDGALLVNVGRGTLIDEDALIDVMRKNKISAILDVFQSEPLDKSSQLWTLPNAFVTPHISGKSFRHSPHTERVIAEICADNISAFLSGKKIRNIIDRKSGYAIQK